MADGTVKANMIHGEHQRELRAFHRSLTAAEKKDYKSCRGNLAKQAARMEIEKKREYTKISGERNHDISTTMRDKKSGVYMNFLNLIVLCYAMDCLSAFLKVF